MMNDTMTRIGRTLRRGALAATLLTLVMSTEALAAKKAPPRRCGPTKPPTTQPLGAPEIDPSLLAGGILLLVGGTLVLTGGKRAPQS